MNKDICTRVERYLFFLNELNSILNTTTTDQTTAMRKRRLSRLTTEQYHLPYDNDVLLFFQMRGEIQPDGFTIGEVFRWDNNEFETGPAYFHTVGRDLNMARQCLTNLNTCTQLLILPCQKLAVTKRDLQTKYYAIALNIIEDQRECQCRLYEYRAR